MIKRMWMFVILTIGTTIACLFVLKGLVHFGIGSTLVTSFNITPQASFGVSYALIGVVALWLTTMFTVNMK